jgi:hypothetical protein
MEINAVNESPLGCQPALRDAAGHGYPAPSALHMGLCRVSPPSARRCAPIKARHLGRRRRLVNKDKLFRVEFAPSVDPSLAFLLYVGPLLLGRMSRLLWDIPLLSSALVMMPVLEARRSGPMSIVILKRCFQNSAARLAAMNVQAVVSRA